MLSQGTSLLGHCQLVSSTPHCVSALLILLSSHVSAGDPCWRPLLHHQSCLRSGQWEERSHYFPVTTPFQVWKRSFSGFPTAQPRPGSFWSQAGDSGILGGSHTSAGTSSSYQTSTTPRVPEHELLFPQRSRALLHLGAALPPTLVRSSGLSSPENQRAQKRHLLPWIKIPSRTLHFLP